MGAYSGIVLQSAKGIFHYKSVLFLLFLFHVILFFFVPDKIDETFLTIVLISMVLSVTIFLKYYKNQWKVIKWISPSVLFSIGYIIVHFQMLFYLLIGFELRGHLFEFIWVSESIVNKSASISLLGLLAFQIGYIIKRAKLREPSNISSMFKFYALNKHSTLFMELIAWLIFISFFLSGGSYSYFNLHGVAGFLQMFFNLFLTACIASKLVTFSDTTIKVSIIKYIRQIGLLPNILIILHIVFSMFAGDRGPVIYYIILVFGLYLFKYSKIKGYHLIIVVVLGSTFFTLIGKARRVDSNENIIGKFYQVADEETLSNRFEAQVPLEQTVELAGSVNCLNHVLYNIPDNYEFQLGFFQLIEVASVVPGVPGLIQKATNKESKYLTSANFITYLIQGDNPTYGNGTSITADLYLDFGLAGVIIGLFLLGAYLKKGETALFNTAKSFLLWISILVYFAYSIYIGRSTLLFPFKTVFGAYIIININYILLSRYVIWKK